MGTGLRRARGGNEGPLNRFNPTRAASPHPFTPAVRFGHPRTHGQRHDPRPSNTPLFNTVLAELERLAEVRRAQREAELDGDTEVVYSDAFADAFDKPGQFGEPEPGLGGTVDNPDLRRQRVGEQIDQDRALDRERRRFSFVPRKVWEAKDSEARIFLTHEYGGRCQICDDGFLKRNGEPYIEAIYLVSFTAASWVDRPGNILALCPTCAAKFQHGAVEAEGILDQVRGLRLRAEGGVGDTTVRLLLCGEPVEIRYSERHLLDLQELIETQSTMVETS